MRDEVDRWWEVELEEGRTVIAQGKWDICKNRALGQKTVNSAQMFQTPELEKRL